MPAAAAVFSAAAVVLVEPERSSRAQDRDAFVAVAVVAAGVLPHVRLALAVALVSLHVQPAALAVVAVPAQHVAARVVYQPVAVYLRQVAVAAAVAAAQPEQALATFVVQLLFLDPDARHAP